MATKPRGYILDAVLNPANERLFFSMLDNADQENRELNNQMSIFVGICAILLFVLFIPFGAIKHQQQEAVREMEGLRTTQHRIDTILASFSAVDTDLIPAFQSLLEEFSDELQNPKDDRDGNRLLSLQEDLTEIAIEIDRASRNFQVFLGRIPLGEIRATFGASIRSRQALSENFRRFQALSESFKDIREILEDGDVDFTANVIPDRSVERLGDLLPDARVTRAVLDELSLGLEPLRSEIAERTEEIGVRLAELEEESNDLESTNSSVFRGMLAVEISEAIAFLPVIYVLLVGYFARKTRKLSIWYESIEQFSANVSLPRPIGTFLIQHLSNSHLLSVRDERLSERFGLGFPTLLGAYYLMMISLIAWGYYSMILSGELLYLHDVLIFAVGLIINVVCAYLLFACWLPTLSRSLTRISRAGQARADRDGQPPQAMGRTA